jgi:hypothetical protein
MKSCFWYLFDEGKPRLGGCIEIDREKGLFYFSIPLMSGVHVVALSQPVTYVIDLVWLVYPMGRGRVYYLPMVINYLPLPSWIFSRKGLVNTVPPRQANTGRATTFLHFLSLSLSPLWLQITLWELS